MSKYTRTMAEALKEVYIPEGNMDLMRKAAGGSAQDIKMKDGKLKIDMFTASAIMQIFEKVNKANQKKMETMINSGRKADIVKLSNFAMSKINSEYIPEEKHQVRQLKDPKKEMMIKSKDSGVFVIDKKDFKKYQKKGFFQVEEVELDEAKYLEIDFKDKSTAAKAYDYINNEIWAGGNPPYDDFNQEGNSLQIDHSGNSKDLLDDLKDPKFGLPRNMKFKVAVDESLEEKRVDPADIDMDATDDDIKSADKNIMMQMRKVQSLRGNYAVEFMDGKKVKLPPKIALAVQDKYMKMRRPAEKEKFQSKVAKSYKDMLSALKESLVQEGTWHIAKGGDVKKLKKLMQKPIILGKDGDAAVEAIAPYIGDDELYDDLYDAGKKDGPKADARPLIKAAMKRLGIKEEIELDEKKTITLVKNKQPTAYDRMRRRMNPQDRKTVDASDKKQIKDLESRGWHRSPYDEEVDLDEKLVSARGKDIAQKMNKSKTMKPFAKKVAKMQTVTPDNLEKMLPDYVAGKDIYSMFEEVELDEKKIVLAKGMGKEVINDNGVIKVMKGGKVISDGDYDSGAGKFWMTIEGKKGQVAFDDPEELLKIKEEVELDEAKYDLYHKDFSSAMQHATKMAKKLHGITIDPKEIDDKVATGPSKPGSGKTNKYRLKGDKGSIQVQVYNKGGSKPFELNMYQEEVELDEGTMHDVIVMKKGKVGVSVIANAANVKKMEKKGYKIDGVIEKGSKLLHKEPKRIMKAIKGGDKLNIGEGGMKRVASGHGLKTFKPKPPKPKKESVLDRIDKKLKERKNG